jgi:hypothetical protein
LLLAGAQELMSPAGECCIHPTNQSVVNLHWGSEQVPCVG